MKKIILLFLPLCLCGCLTFSDGSHPAPHEQTALAALKLGDEQLAAGNLNEAADAYNAALRQISAGPLAGQARLGLAAAEMKRGNSVNALSLLNQVYNSADKPLISNLSVNLELMDLLTKNGNLAEAVKHGYFLMDTPGLNADQRLLVLEHQISACTVEQDFDGAALALDNLFRKESNPSTLWLEKFIMIAAPVYPDADPFLQKRWTTRSGQYMIQLIWAQYYINHGPLSQSREICAGLALIPDLDANWRELVDILLNKSLNAQQGGIQGRIGLIMPLSGRMAEYGKPLTMAIEMGLGVISGESQVELFIEDDGNDPENTVAAVERLVNEKQVLAIIGPLSVKTSLAAAEKAQALQVPLISLSQGSFLSESPQEFIFQNYFSPEDQVRTLAQALINNKNKYKLVILAPASNLGQGFAKLMETVLPAQGGTVVFTKYYSLDTTDFVSLLRELNAEYDFDAIFIPDNAERASSVVNAINKTQINTIIMGINLWHTGKFLLSAGVAGQGALFPNAYDAQTEQNRITTTFI
ncbi:MAG: penicillin-binding protein activator, partial [Desulfarculales bacterium]|nr:penicillin-binding protein activator [Desulfarculales bacterium]